MDAQRIAVLAEMAGLDKVLAEFPDDVRIAALEAMHNAAGIDAPTNPAVEPWPPMRAGVDL